MGGLLTSDVCSVLHRGASGVGTLCCSVMTSNFTVWFVGINALLWTFRQNFYTLRFYRYSNSCFSSLEGRVNAMFNLREMRIDIQVHPCDLFHLSPYSTFTKNRHRLLHKYVGNWKGKHWFKWIFYVRGRFSLTCILEKALKTENLCPLATSLEVWVVIWHSLWEQDSCDQSAAPLCFLIAPTAHGSALCVGETEEMYAGSRFILFPCWPWHGKAALRNSEMSTSI